MFTGNAFYSLKAIFSWFGINSWIYSFVIFLKMSFHIKMSFLVVKFFPAWLYGELLNFLHQNMRVTQWMKQIFPSELATESIVCSCIFFKEINHVMGPFMFPKHCQHDLYCTRNRRVNVLPFYWLSFWLRLLVTNPCLAYL